MRCKYCNEVIMGDFHKESECAQNPKLKRSECNANDCT